jgi:sialate O-acetylesterase
MKHVYLKPSIWLISLLLFAGCSIGNRKPYLKLPALINTNMVLQQKTTINIWGWTNPGQKVIVNTSWNNKRYTTQANNTGKFNVEVKTIDAGGPYMLSIDADTLVELKNIMLGEVWVCSGQSNMEFPLASAKSADTEIPMSNYPKIRLFTVERTIAPLPVADCNGSWQECTPETAKHFSAVGYFFGKDLYENLKVPIGLIHASWGGTPSEAWTSQETLKKINEFSKILEKLNSDNKSTLSLTQINKLTDSIKTINAKAFDFNNSENIGKKEHWMAPDYNDQDWPEIESPSEWSTHPEIGILEGVMWMRKKINIPTTWIGQDLNLELGAIDEMDETYCNGIVVGSNNLVSNWNKPRKYQIPAKAVTSNTLTIAVRVLNSVTEGGVIGNPNELKISPLKSDIRNKQISLAGTWKYKIEFHILPLPPITNPNTPTYLYNGMIHPLLPMVIKGVIWYQGESNVAKANQYKYSFPALINDWRSNWGIGEFPFYFVQIAPFDYGKKYIGAELREAQRLTQIAVPNTGMVVTLDIGNPENIHPTNKHDVGKRLSLWALNKNYGFKLVPSGPLYSHFDILNKTIKVHFNYASQGLMCKDKQLTSFEIAGKDHQFHDAKARIEGQSVIVWSDSVSEPAAVRFGWSNTAEPNLFNAEGLPASSFNSEWASEGSDCMQ